MGLFGTRGAVRIELERDVVRPGEIIRGAVVVGLDESIKAAGLQVVVSGQECMMWKRTIGGTPLYHAQTKDYLKQEIILVPGNTPFTVGETRYTFACVIPADAHASFSYAAKNVGDLTNVKVSTEYKVETVLDVRGLGGWDLKAEATFAVDPPPQQAPLPNAISKRHVFDVAFLSVIKRGSCTLTLDLDSDVLVPSSTIRARVGLSMETTSSLRKITLVLYEDAVVNRHGAIFKGLKSSSRVVCKRRFQTSELGSSPFLL